MQGSMSRLRVKEPGMHNEPTKPRFDLFLHSCIGRGLFQCSHTAFTIIPLHHSKHIRDGNLRIKQELNCNDC